MAHSPEHQESLPLNPLIGEALPVPMPAPVYNPERVWQRLALPLLQEENHISADLEIFHVQKRSSLLRIMTGLEAETKIYLGGWYYQGEEPTYTPWAIANAGRVLGLTVSVDFMMDLMSLACRNRGLDFGEASIVLASHYQCSSFELVRASKKGLTSLVRVNYKPANDSQNPDRAAEKRAKLLKNCIFFDQL